MKLQSLLQEQEYPGRFIIVGMIKDQYVIVYGVTARSAASKAKRYVFHEDKKLVTVEATDPAVMAQGDLDLLQYNPVYFFENGVVVGNGRQTDEVIVLDAENAATQLRHDLKSQSFEIDKYNTPRITGCLLKQNDTVTAALHIIRADAQANTLRDVYQVALCSEKGMFISTYNGPNIRPTPSFIGGPKEVGIDADSLQELVKSIFESLAPKPNQEDLRVSVVAICYDLMLAQKEVCIINSVDEVDP